MSVWSLSSSLFSFLGARGDVNSPQNEESAQQGEGSAQPHASTHPTSQQNHAHPTSQQNHAQSSTHPTSQQNHAHPTSQQNHAQSRTHPTSQQNHAHSGGTMGPPPPAAALEGGGLRSSAIPPQSVRSAAHSTSSVSSGHSHISRDSQVGAGASNLMQMAQGGQNLPTIPLKSGPGSASSHALSNPSDWANSPASSAAQCRASQCGSVPNGGSRSRAFFENDFAPPENTGNVLVAERG